VIVGLVSFDGSRLHMGLAGFYSLRPLILVWFFHSCIHGVSGLGVLLLFLSERSYSYYLLFYVVFLPFTDANV